jgi:hypothetical protein
VCVCVGLCIREREREREIVAMAFSKVSMCLNTVCVYMSVY